ncbi:hypothetical protein CK227_10345 [Mesorhizobium sp. WSM4308]|uniref:hypothetical protein n=1 Tax=Mesorhizobium sp. WSM4308 TaxID=2029409 RepID=UPI000BAE9D7F|nr:hypothetical protein [Mesorhizobium sp. WSM4308]PBB75183.1 hypothetical protein CK227_10345 [Mesorhizobium sp. WSM4308]
MSDQQRKEPNWREEESMEAAASRLLRVLDERAKKRAAGAQSPARILDRPLSPDEGADGESDLGSGSLDRRPQLTDSREELASGLEYGRRADLGQLDYVFEKIRPKDTARPISGRILDEGRSRESYAPEDGE